MIVDSMRKKHVISLSVGTLLIAIIVALVGIRVLQIRTMIEAGAGEAERTTVSATEVTHAIWEARLPAVGSVTAVEGTLVSTEVAGIVQEIAFQPGTEVAAGALLVQLEDSLERAHLAQAEAELELARKNVVRARDLHARNSIPQSEVDAAEANLGATEAAAAARRSALEKKRIVAPFAGKLGLRQISIGQFLDPGSPVVDLQASSPIFVEFSLPQAHLRDLANGLPVQVLGVPGDPVGEISAIASLIDSATRNVRVQALFENSDGALWPGMFVKAEVLLPDSREVRMIPQTAVTYNAYGDSVYLVEEADGGLIARQKFVRLGERRGDFVEVIEGLDPDQRVVRAGAFKLSNEMPITLSDTAVAEASLEPTPANR